MYDLTSVTSITGSWEVRRDVVVVWSCGVDERPFKSDAHTVVTTATVASD